MTWKIFLRLRYVQLHMHWEQTHSTACESCESFQSSWKKSSGHSKTNPSSTSPRSSHILDSPRGHWWSQPHGREHGIHFSGLSGLSGLATCRQKCNFFGNKRIIPTALNKVANGVTWCYSIHPSKHYSVYSSVDSRTTICVYEVTQVQTQIIIYNIHLRVHAPTGPCCLVDLWVIWPHDPTLNGLIWGNHHETSH